MQIEKLVVQPFKMIGKFFALKTEVSADLWLTCGTKVICIIQGRD